MSNRLNLALRMARLLVHPLNKPNIFRPTGSWTNNYGSSCWSPLSATNLNQLALPFCQTHTATKTTLYGLAAPMLRDNSLSMSRISGWTFQPARHFHAAGSKIKYLDFRHKLRTTHLRLNMLLIRRQKMKKHKLRKFRKKFKSLLAKRRLKREIAKEKAFRVELLTYIRRAENFDPKEYALQKIAEADSTVIELTKEERLEKLKALIREHRYQTSYLKPKHIRAD